jgi:hypothetical protein
MLNKRHLEARQVTMRLRWKAKGDKGDILIYGLVDPICKELFYIGATRQQVYERVSQHIAAAHSTVHGNSSRRVRVRIRAIRASGARPKIIAPRTW